MQYFVYVIGQDLEYPYSSCYVGVTNDLKRRWKYHSKSPYTVGCFIRENNLTYEINMKVIHMGTEQECFDVEATLRPRPMMGLNEAAGGCGGHTSYSTARNAKISAKLAGRDITWASKISEARLQAGTGRGSANGRARKWKLISPAGEEYNNHGSIQETCKSMSLLWSTLNKYKGSTVPPIQTGYGGFRPLNDEHLALRQNTTGWSLHEVKEI